MREFYSRASFKFEFSESIEDMVKAGKVEIVDVLGNEMVKVISSDMKCRKKKNAKR